MLARNGCDFSGKERTRLFKLQLGLSSDFFLLYLAGNFLHNTVLQSNMEHATFYVFKHREDNFLLVFFFIIILLFFLSFGNACFFSPGRFTALFNDANS